MKFLNLFSDSFSKPARLVFFEKGGEKVPSQSQKPQDAPDATKAGDATDKLGADFAKAQYDAIQAAMKAAYPDDGTVDVSPDLDSPDGAGLPDNTPKRKGAVLPQKDATNTDKTEPKSTPPAQKKKSLAKKIAALPIFNLGIKTPNADKTAKDLSNALDGVKMPNNTPTTRVARKGDAPKTLDIDTSLDLDTGDSTDTALARKKDTPDNNTPA